MCGIVIQWKAHRWSRREWRVALLIAFAFHASRAVNSAAASDRHEFDVLAKVLHLLFWCIGCSKWCLGHCGERGSSVWAAIMVESSGDVGGGNWGSAGVGVLSNPTCPEFVNPYPSGWRTDYINSIVRKYEIKIFLPMDGTSVLNLISYWFIIDLNIIMDNVLV